MIACARIYVICLGLACLWIEKKKLLKSSSSLQKENDQICIWYLLYAARIRLIGVRAAPRTLTRPTKVKEK